MLNEKVVKLLKGGMWDLATRKSCKSPCAILVWKSPHPYFHLNYADMTGLSCRVVAEA